MGRNIDYVTNTHMVGCAAELVAHAAALTPSGEVHVIPTSHVDLVSYPRLIIAHAAAWRSEMPIFGEPSLPHGPEPTPRA